MKRWIRTILLTAAVLLVADVGAQDRVATSAITRYSAGQVQLGMTVAAVRRIVAPTKLRRTSDGEGIALIAVMRGATRVMTLYAGEENRDAKIDESPMIKGLKRYQTIDGPVDG